jgi:sugar phosphate isomerase/epimerase
MKLSVSNIAWLPEEEASALAMLAAEGVDGIEVAPTLAFGTFDAGRRELTEFRRRAAAHGLEIPALQSLLFGRPALQLFDPGCHEALLHHLSVVASMASTLGAEVLVFGSPASRRRGDLSVEEATEMAVPLFRRMGDGCAREGVSLAIEHNPAEYGCDFLNSVEEAAVFVDVVAHPSIGVNLDCGGLTLSGDGGLSRLEGGSAVLHVHLSEPHLAPVGRGGSDFGALLASLRQRGYYGWVSIEMKRPPDGLAGVRASVATIRALLEELGP